MKYVMYIVILFTTLTVTAAERQMLTTLEAYNRMQDQMLTYRSAGERQNLTTQELLVQTPEAQPQRQMLSTLNAYHNSLAWQMGGQSSYPKVTQPPMPSPQWYDYPSQHMYAAPIMYQQPMYAAPYPQQYSQSVAEWLFGTPRSRPLPAEVAEPAPETVQVAAVIAPQPFFREAPTPVPALPTPVPETTQSDLSAIAQADAARIKEQADAEQHLALLAQATRQAQQDAFRWMGLTIAFGLLTGGVCLYVFWHTGYKEG